MKNFFKKYFNSIALIVGTITFIANVPAFLNREGGMVALIFGGIGLLAWLVLTIAIHKENNEKPDHRTSG
ncbi:hypothetical protein [Ornithinibacillus halophilus]|uniref:Uncharacterized protein n=1 Tax=Ornithinibacillus halophilus TaxID=930117 RepID=A0A1M5HQ21_9BACI|nr:hypothetical protein [Ornithinibacillus halophilus]SHG18061.1 hypothetical protein SAMN05216225_10194 [Ornithinibacillus halophilus]